MIYVPNRKVACSTLGKYRNVVMKGTNFKTAEQKGALLPLTVIFGNERYEPGDTVYIRGDAMTMPWSKEEFSDGDATFILVPEDYIQLRKTTCTLESTNES